MKTMFSNSPSASYGVAVTPSDSATFANGQTRNIFVGGAGNLAVKFANGSTLTLTGVTAGSMLPIAVIGVMATGTTATNIAALF